MPRAAVNKLNADILFQRGKRTADGLQGAIETASGLRQASRFRDMNECFKVFEAAHAYLANRD
ncbi:hypothetical protein D3C80_2230070 [compost metagenome]